MSTVTHEMVPSDTPSDAVACQGGVHAVDSRGFVYTVTPDAVVIESRRGRSVRPLDDPGDPVFAALPHIDVSDGRSLRRVALEHWTANLGARLVAGAAWETTYHARRPYHTAFGMLGGTLVGGSALWAVLAWASSDPQVRHQPGVVGGIVLLAGVALLVWIAFGALSSALRFWLTRRGSYVRIDARGVTVSKGARPRPASDVVHATYHAWLRATELRLRDGARVWVPRERGPLARLDLVLAALPGGPPAAF